jgi:hypothetical protein
MREREGIVRVNSLFNRVSNRACHDLQIEPCKHPRISAMIEKIGYRETLRQLDAERDNFFAAAGMREGERNQIKEHVQAHYENCLYCKAVEVRWGMQRELLAGSDEPGSHSRPAGGVTQDWEENLFPYGQDSILFPSIQNSGGGATLSWWSAAPLWSVLRLAVQSVAAMCFLLLVLHAVVNYHQYASAGAVANPWAAIGNWLGGDVSDFKAGLYVKPAGQAELKAFSLGAPNKASLAAASDARAIEQFIEALGQVTNAKSHEYMVISQEGDVFLSELKKTKKKRAVMQSLPLDQQRKSGAFHRQTVSLRLTSVPEKDKGLKTYLDKQAEGIQDLFGKVLKP